MKVSVKTGLGVLAFLATVVTTSIAIGEYKQRVQGYEQQLELVREDVREIKEGQRELARKVDLLLVRQHEQ